MYDFVYSSNCLWNKDYDGSMRLTYDEIIRPLLLDIRARIGGLDLHGQERPLPLESARKNLPPELWDVTPYDAAAVCSKDQPWLEIPVDGFARLFTVVHATDVSGGRELWKSAVKIGEYRIEYADGTAATQDILYGDNIYKFSSRFGMPLESPLFRHEGYVASYMSQPQSYKDRFGNDCTLLKNFIKNPHPEKPVRSLQVTALGNTDAKILLFSAAAVN